MTTLTGGTQGFTDGVGKEAKFYHPTGISIDTQSGILYIADHVMTGNFVISNLRVLTPVALPNLFLSWSLCPVASLLVRVWVKVVSIIHYFFTNHRLCLERRRVSSSLCVYYYIL